MAKTTERLTALRVQRERRPGKHPDGNGLFLYISNTGSRSWVLRYMLHRRRHDLGLGSVVDVSLADARRKAREARSLKADGIDPLATKHASRAAARAAEAKAVTFAECADAYIGARRAGWRNTQHAKQWRQSMDAYVLPTIGTLPAAAIDTALVLRVLQPIWETKTETATRVRNRIELVLDWARARGYRDAENPARWKGHLDHLLPNSSKVVQVKHHPALPYGDLTAFMSQLRLQEGIGARALEFLILTVARSGEVRFATGIEFDTGAAVWTIPASRMKSGREHRVPLSPPALMLVETVCARISANAMVRALSKLRSGLTVHGFRSTFRDWSAEQTSYPSEIVELCLAHTVGSAVERAYRRTDLFDKRRALMDEWAQFCGKAA
jgi:integrase